MLEMKTNTSQLRWLHEQLSEWEQQALITPANSARLRELYPASPGASDRSLAHVLLGCFGALLVAAGVILILAHNWEELTRPARGLIALGCLACGQLAVVWTWWRKRKSAAWREGSATLLAMGLPACIALIGQTYHLPGDLESFLLVWALLILPLPYLLRSGSAFLLLQVVLTTWVVYAGPSAQTLLIYAGALAASLPYLWLLAGDRQGLLLRWTVALAFCVTLGFAVPAGFQGSWILTYGFFFSLLLLLSPVATPWGHGWRRYPFAVVGDLGLFVLITLLTWPSFWPGGSTPLSLPFREGYWDFGVILGLAVASVALLITRPAKDILVSVRGGASWVVLAAFMLASGRDYPWAAMILMNLLVLVLAAAHMWQGYRQMRLSLFNFGFLQVSILLLIRFFDSDLGILPRGGTFIVLGIAFLLINSVLSRQFRSTRLPVPPKAETGASTASPGLEAFYNKVQVRLRHLGNTRVKVGLLVVMMVVQLAVPGKMMLDRELTLRLGESFRFETAPVDPYDPFRGRYVALNFTTPNMIVEDWEVGNSVQKAFAVIETGESGSARIASLHRTRPAEGHYLKVNVLRRGPETYHITLPFDRYYMNEHTAPEAERLYLAEARRGMGERPDTYADVRIRRGMGVIAGLYLNGTPVEERVRAAHSQSLH